MRPEESSRTIELLQLAIATIEAIPADKVTLHCWTNTGGLEATAAVKGCVLTWLLRHPAFQSPAYQLAESSEDGWVFVARGRDLAEGVDAWAGWDYAADVFGLPHADAWQLFCNRSCDSRLDPPGAAALSDKDLWLTRARTFVGEFGQTPT